MLPIIMFRSVYPFCIQISVQGEGKETHEDVEKLSRVLPGREGQLKVPTNQEKLKKKKNLTKIFNMHRLTSYRSTNSHLKKKKKKRKKRL